MSCRITKVEYEVEFFIEGRATPNVATITLEGKRATGVFGSHISSKDWAAHQLDVSTLPKQLGVDIAWYVMVKTGSHYDASVVGGEADDYTPQPIAEYLA